MPVVVTARAAEVLRRALEAGRLDPVDTAIRIGLARGLRGEEVRTGFAEEPEPGEQAVEVHGLRLFVPDDLVARGVTIDVSDEHERIVVR
jgi:hypothetical protein